MRHAKSSWDDPDLTDAQRPLNDRGERDAPRMGRYLCDHGPIPDRVLTSPAVRARTTAMHVAEACRIPDRLTVMDALYQADPEDWRTTIAALPAAWNCVLCVGHNPELEEFIGVLTSRYVRMPTAAIARLTCDAPDWQAFVESDQVIVEDVWRPKEIK